MRNRRYSVHPRSGPVSADDFFHALRSYWTPLPPGIQESFLGRTKEFMELEIRLRDDQSLVEYDGEIYPELSTLLRLSSEDRALEAAGSAAPRAVLHMCTQQLHIMENVFLAVKLDRYHSHPLNRGWMNLFRRWSGNPTMGLLWPSLKSAYSKDFVAFADYQLNFTWMDIIPTKHAAHSLPLAALFALRDPGQVATLTTPLTPLQRLFRELGQEWPNLLQTRHRHPGLAEVQAESNTSIYFDPFSASTEIWTIAHPYAVQEEIWGIALLAPHPQDPSLERLLVWIRPAYRGVGLGTKLLSSVLMGDDTEEMNEARQKAVTEKKQRLLVVLPPLWRDKPGYRDEMAGWLRFYERQRFVRTTVKDAEKLLKWDTQENRFNPEAFCLVMPEMIQALRMAER